MRPIKVKWGKLSFELPGELTLILLAKASVLLFYFFP
jgi:hypothetical protein